MPGYGSSTIYRILAKYRDTGDVITCNLPVGRKRKLGATDVQFLLDSVARTPDTELEELSTALREDCGIMVSAPTIYRELARHGLTRKKITKPALERDEELRTRFRLRMLEYAPEDLVFVDESACNRHTFVRKYGRALCGARAQRHDFFVKGTKYSILPALSLDGILHTSILEGSHNGDTFLDFIDGLLDRMNPYPNPKSVIVLDNASIHHGEDAVEMVEDRGMRIEFLPPYSPDLNPIEEAFSSMKAWIRHNRNTAQADFMSEDGFSAQVVLWDAIHSITAEKVQGWFKHSGYI